VFSRTRERSFDHPALRWHYDTGTHLLRRSSAMLVATLPRPPTISTTTST
jgi:hypothetical protein